MQQPDRVQALPRPLDDVLTRLVRLLVVRHGRTEWNATGRFQGTGDPPLDHVGRRQAADLAAALAALRPAPSRVVSSDLHRARQTAAEVASACGLSVVVDPGLREVDLGSWEGLTREQAKAAFPEEYRRWQAGEDIPRGGGETVAEAGARAAAVIRRVAEETAAGELSVLVAHGIVLQTALHALARAGALVAPDLSSGAPHLGNAEWLAVDLRIDTGTAAARSAPTRN